MNNEQSITMLININSKELESILRSNIDLINNATSSIKLSNGVVTIEENDNPYIVEVPSNDKKAFKKLLDILKVLVKQDSKIIISAIKKSKKVILSEVSYDWSCTEVYYGELAKDMLSFAEDKQTNKSDKTLESYIVERTYKNKEYCCNEKPVYKD